MRAWIVKPGMAALLLGFGWLAAALWTLGDYAPQWDCWEFFTGDRCLQFYRSGDTRCLDFAEPLPMPLYQQPGHPDFQAISHAARRNPALVAAHHIWPLGPLSASFTEALTWRWLGVIEGYHLAIVCWFLLLLAGVYAWGRTALGPAAALLALAGLAIHPHLWVHAHVNLKDIPAAAMFSLTLASCWWAARRESWRWLLVSGLLWGLGLATKANLLFLPVVLLPWAAFWTWRHYWQPRRLPPRPLVLAALLYPLAGLLALAAAWPYLFLELPTHLQAHVAYLCERGYGAAAGWQAGPLRLVLWTTPPGLLALLALGLGRIAWLAWQRRLDDVHLLLLLWLGVPILRVSMPGASDFDGIRHWLEFLPAAALIAGLGGQWFGGWLGERVLPAWASAGAPGWRRPLLGAAAAALLFLPTVAWSLRVHPGQLAYFNFLAGGLPGAQARGVPDATDYWGSSYRAGLRWLNAHAEPGSLVLAGPGDQFLAYLREVWLRPDLIPLSALALPPGDLAARVQAHPGAVYVLYVVRPEFYNDFVQTVDDRVAPCYAVRVDGVPVLKVLRLRDAHGRLPAPGDSR